MPDGGFSADGGTSKGGMTDEIGVIGEIIGAGGAPQPGRLIVVR
jgi:hypothetical protein